MTADGRRVDAGSSRSARPRKAGRGTLTRILVIVGVGAALVAVGLATAVYTERPQFCPVCHEMGPYYDAWTAGPHANTSCVECHVDQGVIAHGLHKFVALKEVWDHFTKDNRFPTYGVELPNARCLRCHATVRTVGGSRFDHFLHANKAACKECHPTTGHSVTSAALKQAGILTTTDVGAPVPGGLTPSSAPGHIKVSCQGCHDQAKMRCSLCHAAPHEARGECSDCHQPGTRFKFAHPAGTDCVRCHKPPANHFGPSCASCHTPGVPFASATFRHPATGEHSFRSFPCAKCHPDGYTKAYCSCHKGKPPTGD